MIKKIYNQTDTLVDEALKGAQLLYPDNAECIPGTRFIVRKEWCRKPKGLVKMVMGGGAGHEGPGLNGIGPGGYDLCIVGDVFAAPSASRIAQAISEIDDGSPIVLSVTNHAGDVMNTGLAVKMCRAKGINISRHIIYNDVASAPKGCEKERRAIIGAYDVTPMMAEWGESMEDILRVAEKTNTYTRSYGVGIRSAIHPVTGLPIMPMPDEKMELGIGVHGESSGRQVDMMSSRQLAALMCDEIMNDMPLEKGEKVAVKLQGLGGLSWMEIQILYGDIYDCLTKKGIEIYRVSAGNNGTQELGGVILSIGKTDEEIRKWMETGLPSRYTEGQVWKK